MGKAFRKEQWVVRTKGRHSSWRKKKKLSCYYEASPVQTLREEWAEILSWPGKIHFICDTRRWHISVVPPDTQNHDWHFLLRLASKENNNSFEEMRAMKEQHVSYIFPFSSKRPQYQGKYQDRGRVWSVTCNFSACLCASHLAKHEKHWFSVNWKRWSSVTNILITESCLSGQDSSSQKCEQTAMQPDPNISWFPK